jgi:hypothetical protein
MKGSILAALDNLTRIDALRSNHTSSVQASALSLLEHQLSKRSATTWVMKNGLHNTLNLSCSFGSIQGPKLRSTFPVVSMCLKHVPISFPLTAQDVSHSKQGRAKPKLFQKYRALF